MLPHTLTILGLDGGVRCFIALFFWLVFFSFLQLQTHSSGDVPFVVETLDGLTDGNLGC